MVYRKHINLFAVTAFALLVGYSDAIISSGFDVLFNAKYVSYADSVCSRKTDGLVCGKSVSIELNQVEKDNGIFIGGIYPSGEIVCDNGKIILKNNPSDLVTLRQAKSGTILHAHELAVCDKSFSINFIGSNQTKRFGLYTGRLVQAEENFLNRLNEVHNFIQLVLPNLLLGLFMSIMLLATIIAKAYPRIKINLYLCFFGCGVLAARSGTFALIALLFENSNVSLQISNFLIFIFSLVYVSSELSKKVNSHKVLVNIVLVLLMGLCFVQRPAYCFCLASVVALGLGGYFKQLNILIAGVFFASDAGKMLTGNSFLPVSYVSVVFCLLGELFEVITFAYKALTFTKHVEKYSTIYTEKGAQEFESLIQKLQSSFRIYGVSSWTLCLIRDERARLIIVKDGVVKQVDAESTPPIFARAISLGKPIVNENENWAPLGQIKNKLSQNVYSGIFSIYPLMNGSGVLGAIAVNDPHKDFFINNVMKIDFEIFVRTTLDFISKELDVIRMLEKNSWLDKLHDIEGILNDGSDLDTLVVKINEQISNSLDVVSVFARKSEASDFLDYRVVHGAHEDAREIYLGLRTSVKTQNELGPIPLAIKNLNPVILSDVSFMKGWLQSKTLKMFELNSTSSAVALPLVYQGKLKGIIWLESKVSNFFHASLEHSLVLLAEKIALALEQAEKSIQLANKEMLFSTLIPADALDKKSKGLPTKISQFGEITMIDIRKSTQLSSIIGSDKWCELQNSVLKDLKPLVANYNYELAEFTWDAIYLTKKIELESFSVDTYISFVLAINEIISKYIGAFESARHVYTGEYVRICSVYGDISYDFTGLNGLRWAVVGDAIAQVSKIEQLAKGQLGDLFIDQRLTPGFAFTGITKHNLSQYGLFVKSYDLAVLKNHMKPVGSHKSVA